MSTTPGIGNTAVRTVDEQFLDLICSDADLVTAEFDAIIAMEWPTPPAHRRGRDTAGRHRGNEPARPATDPAARAVFRLRRYGIGARVRQRSPPFLFADARQPGRQVIAARQRSLRR